MCTHNIRLRYFRNDARYVEWLFVYQNCLRDVWVQYSLYHYEAYTILTISLRTHLF